MVDNLSTEENLQQKIEDMYNAYEEETVQQQPSMLEETPEPISVKQDPVPESEDSTSVQESLETKIDRLYDEYQEPSGLGSTQPQQAFEYTADLEAPDADKDGKLTYEEMSQDKEFMNKLETYWTNRTDTGIRDKDETDTEYLERFMESHYRGFMYNDIELGDQIAYLSGADDQTKLLFGDVFSKIEQYAPTLIDDEMTGGQRRQAMYDVFAYSMTSVSNWAPLLVSGMAGSLAGPAGTTAAVGAALAATRAGATSAIRNILLKHAAIKPLAKTTIAGAGLAGLEEAAIQNVKRMGSIDPATGKYDPNVKPEDIELDYGGIGVQAGIGAAFNVPTGIAAHMKIKKFNKKREEQLKAIKEAQKKKQKVQGAIDSVTSNPSTGAESMETLVLSNAIEEAKGKKAPLMSVVTENFAIVDNVDPKYQKEALDSLINNGIFDKMAAVSLGVQNDLNKIGMLDVLGEVAATTYGRALRDEDRITAALADGLDGIQNRILSDKDDLGSALRREVGDTETKVAEAVLEDVLSRNNIDKKDFLTFMSYYSNGAISVGDISRKSMSDAAKLMATASKYRKQLLGEVYPNVDPEMRKILDSYAGKSNNKVVSALEFGDAVRTLDRVRISSLTSQLVTTARNVLSGATIVVGQTGVNFIDSLMYQLGSGIKSAAGGKVSKEGIGKGLSEIWSDSWSVITAVVDPAVSNKSQVLVDATMEWTPTLHKTLIRSQPDLATTGQNKFTRAANGYITAINHFNIASDSFFRRAFYMSSLDKRFKRFLRDHKAKTGKDYADGKIKNVMQYIESGRVLDKKMIVGATEDALKMTFAAAPESSFGKTILGATEKLRPFSSVVMPFPRFFANALRTMYEYNPIPANSLSKLYQAMNDKETRSLAGAFGDAQREAYAKNIVGTAAFAFAVNHLGNKEDNTPWYDVNGVDIRAMWPMSAYFATAEMFMDAGVIEESTPRARTNADRKAYFETLSGIPVRGGEQISNLIDSVGALITGVADDSVGTQTYNDRIAEFAADYFGGYLTPLKMAKDIADQVAVDARYKDIRAGVEDEDYSTKITARIANSYLPENIFGYDARVQGQKDAPARQYLLDNAEKMRRHPMARFVGITFTPKTSELERELARVGIKRKDLMPYTGSAQLDNRQGRNFSYYAVDGLRDLVGSDQYNADVNQYGQPMNERQKLNYQKELVKKRASFYRDFVKEATNTEASVEAEARASAMYLEIDKMKERNASTEELAQAYMDVAEYQLYDISNNEMKTKWNKRTSGQNASMIEAIFAKRHEEAVIKQKTTPELLTVLDYMYLRGPTILEQRSFGLALAEYESYQEYMGEQATGRTPLN